MKKIAESGRKLKVGEESPNFSLSDQKGERHSLFEYRSEWVLLYFFRKKEMDSCTEERCLIRDDFGAFRARRVYVMGVSVASVDELFDFGKTFNIHSRLLSDRDKKVHKLYGIAVPRATQEESGGRTCLLVNPQGRIAKMYEADATSLAATVMADLMAIPETENRRVAPEDMKLPGIPERRFRT